MSRRFHKKSRNGCLECKRRHMRCDENHPICGNCGAAEIRCSFLAKHSPHIVPAFSQAHSEVTATAASINSTEASTPIQVLRFEPDTSKQESFDSYSINMTHMELFNNLFTPEFLSFEDSGQPDAMPTSVYIKYAVTTPYLMHQVLAISALHLSTRIADSQDYYREYATGLQNRGLSLFNKTNPVIEVSSSNCIHMFLFSSLVGVHVLCDTLLYQRDSLEEFIDRFTHCLNVYRGVLAVTAQSKDLLFETELGPRLKTNQVLEQPTEVSGLECDALQGLVDAADVTSSSQRAYQEAVLRLQQVFNAISANKARMHMVFTWPVLISSEYVDLLRHRQPEALIILAYYAVLLHRGREWWLVGASGRFLIESITGSLGSEWQQWLKFPAAALRMDMTA